MTGRFVVEAEDPYDAVDQSPAMSRMSERNWDVVQFTRVEGGAYHRPVTGASHVASTLPQGRWSRGELVRSSQPVFSLTYIPMYDPSDPNNWIPHTGQ